MPNPDETKLPRLPEGVLDQVRQVAFNVGQSVGDTMAVVLIVPGYEPFAVTSGRVTEHAKLGDAIIDMGRNMKGEG